MSNPEPADGRPADYFDALYTRDPDPWRFETSAYEQAKYAATLAALPPSIGAALEIGCSIGVFTKMLAARCGAVLALDPSAPALAAARDRCAGLPVTFRQGAVPQDWPEGRFDAILFAEVLYFLPRAAVAPTARRAAAALAPGGTILLVNWAGETGTILSGEAAASLFSDALPGWRQTILRQPGYRLDRLQPPEAAPGSPAPPPSAGRDR